MENTDSYLKKQQKNFSFALITLPIPFIYHHDWFNALLAVAPLVLSHLFFKFQVNKRKRSSRYLKQLLGCFIFFAIAGAIGNNYCPESWGYPLITFLALIVMFIVDYKAADESKQE